MEIKDVKKNRASVTSNESESYSTLSQEYANMNVYELSTKLYEFWTTSNADGIIAVLQNIKGSCKNPIELLSAETFYPVILPFIISALQLSDDPEKNNLLITTIKFESLSILNGVSLNIALDRDLLKETLTTIYSLLFDKINFRPEYVPIFEQCFSILTTFIGRGGSYAYSVADYLYLSRFLDFLECIQSDSTKHAATIFIISFKKLEKIQNPGFTSKMAQIINQTTFSNSDRLILLHWLLNLVPNSFTLFNPETILQFIYSIIIENNVNVIEQESINNNRALAIDCLTLIIKQSHILLPFDYSAIFRYCFPTNNQYNVDERVFENSLKCMIALISLGPEEMIDLSNKVDIKRVLYEAFNNGHSISSQKSAFLLISTIIGDNPDSRKFAFNFIDNALIVSLISLLEIDDDPSLIQDLFKCFEKIIGDQKDEFSMKFLNIFKENDGWSLVNELTLSSSTKIHNCATIFIHLYDDIEIPDN